MKDTIQKAYIAYYGRPADPDGLAYWTQRLKESDGDLSAIVQDFGQSEEFETRFGTLNEVQLIENLYDQVLGRAADSEGLDFYSQQLTAGLITPIDIALRIADGAKGDDVAIVENRIEVANEFTQTLESEGLAYGSDQVETASEIIKNVGFGTSVNSYFESTVKPSITEIFPPMAGSSAGDKPGADEDEESDTDSAVSPSRPASPTENQEPEVPEEPALPPDEEFSPDDEFLGEEPIPEHLRPEEESPPGDEYWLDRLETDLGRDDVLSHFSESEENLDNTQDLIAAGIEYVAWDSEAMA